MHRLTEEGDCRYRYFRQAAAASDRWDGDALELKGVRGAGLLKLRECRSHWVLEAQQVRVAAHGVSASPAKGGMKFKARLVR